MKTLLVSNNPPSEYMPLMPIGHSLTIMEFLRCPAIGPFDMIVVPPCLAVRGCETRQAELTRWLTEWLPTRLAPKGVIVHL